MAELTKRFELDAGHRLSKHDFECQNLHGHRYRFEITIQGRSDPSTGMIVDFANVKNPVMDAFDHNLILNESDPLVDAREALEEHQERELYLTQGEPTGENIAAEALDLMESHLSSEERNRVEAIIVELYETPNSSVKRKRELTG